MLFELNARQIRDRHLSDADFSEVAGFNVRTFKLSDFPHFKDLIKNRDLPEDQLLEREHAVYAALYDAVGPAPDNTFCGESAKFIASNGSATVYGTGSYTSGFPASLFGHFHMVKEMGFEKAHEAGSPIWLTSRFSTGSSTTDVFPGVINEAVSTQNAFRTYAAFILTDQNTSAEDYWSSVTLLPPSSIMHMPNDNMHVLYSDLHECRHLQQIWLESSSGVTKFYQELDADMSARAKLRMAGVGQETRKANLHSRYMQMLLSEPKYSFAASMEALEKRKQPEDYGKTLRSVLELMLRIAIQYYGKNHRHDTSAQLQRLIDADIDYTSSMGTNGRKTGEYYYILQKYTELRGHLAHDPSLLYTALRQVVESRAITDPFVEKLAIRILDAASYFNPDLIYGDYSPSRRRMAKWFDRLRVTQLRRAIS